MTLCIFLAGTQLRYASECLFSCIFTNVYLAETITPCSRESDSITMSWAH
jgi:hypothetical protein